MQDVKQWLGAALGKKRSRGMWMGIFAALLWISIPAASEANDGIPLGGLCPAGYLEQTNSGFSFADVGCSICSPDASCMPVGCLTVPVMICPPGPSEENTTCCTANPCSGNCPEPEDPLQCTVQICTCEPDGCCTVVCPTPRMAPVAGSHGLAFLALALAATGMFYGRRRHLRVRQR